MIHLLFSANRWEAAEQIRKAIDDGVTVVVDRYYYSGIVYSAAKGKPDLSLEWARQPEIGLPRPDLCLFLDLTAECASKRADFGNEKYETSAMQKRVREVFYELMATKDGLDIQVIDAGRNVEEVEKDVFMRVEGLMRLPKMKQQLTTVLPLDMKGKVSVES